MTDDAVLDGSTPDLHTELIAAALRQHEAGLRGGAVEDVTETLTVAETGPVPPHDSFTGYQIIREIHRGGQGVVYQAYQKSTSRKVAIKVMRDGPFAGPGDKARFEREVQVLGQLKHPNIVAIHDTGIAAGSHFFVMDYISGQPLDVYMAGASDRPEEALAGSKSRWARRGSPRAPADGPGLSIASTLRLFAKICEAVNAAHLRGVIHRDLKPGNIRVDENGEPHVLDFGLAKVALAAGTGIATGSEVEQPVMTMTGQFVGSLPWASPEQAEGSTGKIDIRTDVYSLGVILYQMLTGRFPYQVVGNMRDVLDRISSAEPVRPRTVRRQINDEVETIVLKCLSKQRERRYQSAGELARDVDCFLRGEPIEAKRDSTLYLLRKTFRRYRAAVYVVAAFMILTTAASIGLSIMYRHQSRERQRAEHEARRADHQLKNAELTADFMADMLKGAQASVAQGRDTVVLREMLDKAANRVEGGEFNESPEVELRLRRTIGDIYNYVADGAEAWQRAEAILLPTLELAERAYGPRSREMVKSLNIVAGCLGNLGRPEEALPKYETALDILQQSFSADDAAIATCQNNLAYCLQSLGRSAEALPRYEAALATYRRLYQGDHRLIAMGTDNVGYCLVSLDRPSDALPFFVAAQEMRQRLFQGDHPDLALSLNNVADCLRRLGRSAEALPGIEASLEMCQRLFKGDHADTADTLNNVGFCLQSLARLPEALARFEAALAMYRRLYEGDHPLVAKSLGNVAACLHSMGRSDEGLQKYQSALEMFHRVQPSGHGDTLGAQIGMGRLLVDLKRFDEAERELREAVDQLDRNPSAPPSLQQSARTGMVMLYDAWHAAEPDQGYDAKAAEWRAKLARWQATTQPARPPSPVGTP